MKKAAEEDSLAGLKPEDVAALDRQKNEAGRALTSAMLKER